MYHIDGDKLAAVVEIANEEIDPRATEAEIRGEICADWHENEEHQEWLDKASAEEIADWIASFYG